MMALSREKMQPLHDIKSAAALLGLSPWTVRAYVREGKLRPVRLGRRVMLEEEELARFVSENRTQPRPQQPEAQSAEV